MNRILTLKRWLALAPMVAIAVVAAVSAGAGTASATPTGKRDINRTESYTRNECIVSVRNPLKFWGPLPPKRLTLAQESKKDTDSWIKGPPALIPPVSDGDWHSQSGPFRGCHNDVKYDIRNDARPEVTLAQVHISETL